MADIEDEIKTLKRPLVENYSDGEEEEEKRRKIEERNYQSRHCPYLDTIDRHVLDFDFEKLCSISLSHVNVYACLVCGKYFQGRGRHSHAYTHSVSVDHHVFLNLHTLKFYCLPDNYEVIDSSLEDIKYVLNPTFTKEDIKLMDSSAKMSRAFDGTTYLPELSWVDTAVVLCSKKRFQFTEQGDPVDFLSWFLNALHTTLGGSVKKANTIIFKSFQGRMKIKTRKVPQTENEEEKTKQMNEEEYQEKVSESPYLLLNMDIPASPLFKDELQQNIIPQQNHSKELFIKKFELTKLPRYLIMSFKRFAKNTFFTEKNPTVVNFPVKGIDMAEYLSSDPKVQDAHPRTTYDLIANICHEGDPEGGTYRLFVLHKGANKWYELQDLHVKEILPQVITLSDSYCQVRYIIFDYDL
ncbi:U4/U6.U5 tri-snRNP-associated protein 2 [Exaiptasia diaphana]|uniref:ubiquitinyl hydrolase 1 n=1 Tax=Exaiptasia diaphana TaxID=2652724 RepID=A0A913YKI1_EXADI|nr:U4/U6.U5 tri-snRNP-associated protein 2 [Exaiptasia diaphana]